MRGIIILNLLTTMFMFSTTITSKSLLRFPDEPSGENHVTLHPDLTLARNEFSVCTWLRRKLNTNSVGMSWFNYVAPKSRAGGILLNTASFHVMVASGVAYRLKFNTKTMHGEWYHMCYTWKSGYAEFYINGVLVPLTGLHPIGQVVVGGSIILGQRQESFEEQADVMEKFVGDIYQLNVFKKTLTLQDVTEMYYNGRCVELCRALAYEVVMSWTDVLEKGEVKGEVTQEEGECDTVWGVLSGAAQRIVGHVKMRRTIK